LTILDILKGRSLRAIQEAKKSIMGARREKETKAKVIDINSRRGEGCSCFSFSSKLVSIERKSILRLFFALLLKHS